MTKVTGLVLPYGVKGRTSTGSLTVPAGVVTLPADISRVKLLRDHSDRPKWAPVGRAIACENKPDGLYMTFELGDTPDGQTALADINAGIRDAFSVELLDIDIRGEVLQAGILSAVALVPIPAYDDARVSSVYAAAASDRTVLAFDNSSDSPPLTTITDDSFTAPLEAPPSEKDTMTTPLTETEAATPVEATPDTEAKETETVDISTTDEVLENSTEKLGTNAPAPEVTAGARAPRGLIVNQRPALTFSQAVGAIQRLRTNQATPELTAALADITRSANPAVSAPQWLGQLWDGADYEREIVPTFTQGTLTGMKAVGWRFTQKPVVDDYEGDKTEIPTGPVSTEPVERAAKRLAAGHDIDRAYFDFNEREFLEAFFKARVVDYKIKTDIHAANFAVEAANAAPEITTGAEPDLLHAAARARMVVKQRTRTEPTTFLVNPNSMFGLFQITQLDNPAYLNLLGVDPAKFKVTDLVPEGQVVAYARQALTFFELAGSPIRVDAERIDHGGKDSGVFGYWAAMVNNPNGVVSVPFGPDPGI